MTATKNTPKTKRQPRGEAKAATAAEMLENAIVQWTFSWCPEGFAEAMTDKIRLVRKAAKEAKTLASKSGYASGKDRARLVRHVKRVLEPIDYRPGGKKSTNTWNLDLFLTPPLPPAEYEAHKGHLLRDYWFAVPELGGVEAAVQFAQLARRLGEAVGKLNAAKQRHAPKAGDRAAHRPRTSEMEARSKLLLTAKGLGIGVRPLARAIAKMGIAFGEPSLKPPDFRKKPEDLSADEKFKQSQSADDRFHAWENRFHVAASKARK